METIVSRTSTERIIRVGIFMVLVDVFTVLYLWDGYIGYAQQNRAELARALGVSVEQVGPTREDITAWRAHHLRSNFPKEDMEFGKPSIVHDTYEYYLGPGGWLRLGAKHNDPGEWFDGPRLESDIRWQKYIGYTLGIVGFFATLFFARVLATRAALNDDGLQVTGPGSQGLVRWEEITELRADAHKRGVVELEYQSNGSRRTLRMDDYLYKDLARITAAIASKKSLHDPLAALQKA
jgi:hypothetical protein